MTPQLKDFIERHIDWIDLEKYSELYYMCREENIPPHDLTNVLLSCDIDPAAKLKILPKGMYSNLMFLDTIKIPEGVTYISDYCFAFCYSLRTLHLPKSIAHVGDLAFIDCKELESIDYAGTCEEWNNTVDKDELWLDGSSLKHVYCSDGVCNYEN